MLKPGDKAPDFKLKDQDGKTHALADYAGKYFLIYFYPKDDTPGCTKEACGLRDAWDGYGERGVAVLGVSKDTIESHKRFEEKYGLPFTLLADPEKKTIQAYGALRGAFTARISFLVGPDGKIAKAYPKVDPGVHAPEVLADFDALRS